MFIWQKVTNLFNYDAEATRANESLKTGCNLKVKNSLAKHMNYVIVLAVQEFFSTISVQVLLILLRRNLRNNPRATLFNHRIPSIHLVCNTNYIGLPYDASDSYISRHQ